MGLVLGKSLMVTSSTGAVIFKSISPFYYALWVCFCCCLQVNYIIYKCFDRSLHNESFDPTCAKGSDLYLLWFLRYWESN